MKTLFAIGYACLAIMILAFVYFTIEFHQVEVGRYSYHKRIATELGGLVGMILSIYFIVLFIMSAIQVKTKLNRITSFISASFTVVFLYTNSIALADYTMGKFDDMSLLWINIFILNIAGITIGLKEKKRIKSDPNVSAIENEIPKGKIMYKVGFVPLGLMVICIVYTLIELFVLPYSSDTSVKAGLMGGLFGLFYMTYLTIGIFRIKSKKARLFNIIGSALSAIFVGINLGVTAGPSSGNFGIFWIWWFLYAFAIGFILFTGIKQAENIGTPSTLN
ncbi:MAG: hypothetical protein JKY54_04810 [Flavobacteriales bacterium]|nr:hypothetical protein [Flavobacteriales bacterium]